MKSLALSLLYLAQSDTDSCPFPAHFVLGRLEQEPATGPGRLPGTQGRRAGDVSRPQCLVMSPISSLPDSFL